MVLERLKYRVFHRNGHDRQDPLPDDLPDMLIRSLHFFQESPDSDNRFAPFPLERWEYHAQQLFNEYWTVNVGERNIVMDWLTSELDGFHLSHVVEMVLFSFRTEEADPSIPQDHIQYREVIEFMQNIFIWANTKKDATSFAKAYIHPDGDYPTKAEVVYESLKKSWYIPEGFFDDILFYYQNGYPVRGLELVSQRYLLDRQSKAQKAQTGQTGNLHDFASLLRQN